MEGQPGTGRVILDRMTAIYHTPPRRENQNDVIYLSSDSCNSSQRSICRQAKDDDVQIIGTEGKKSLFPNDPELSNNFKQYLRKLNQADPKTMLDHRDLNQADNSPLAPYNFITAEDLYQVTSEIYRITRGWPLEERNKLSYDFVKPGGQPSVQVLGFHHFLVSHILAAKRVCAEQYKKKISDKGSDNQKANATELCHFLFWQYNMQKELYRQFLLTSVMTEKRSKAIPTPTKGQASTSSEKINTNKASEKKKSSKRKREHGDNYATPTKNAHLGSVPTPSVVNSPNTVTVLENGLLKMVDGFAPQTPPGSPSSDTISCPSPNPNPRSRKQKLVLKRLVL